MATCDVLIVGSGPIGATYARVLRDRAPGCKIIMVEIGDQESPKRGDHKKNNVVYQKDIDQFVHQIKANLSPVSVPKSGFEGASDGAMRIANISHGIYVENPEQNPALNLPGQAVTRTIGGMATHWTCSTPRFSGSELPKLETDTEDEPEKNANEWNRLYEIAEGYCRTSSNEFNESKRQEKILEILREENRDFKPLPLACRRKTPTYVTWSSAHTIFDFDEAGGNFELRANARCTKLVFTRTPNGVEIKQAQISNILVPDEYIIEAKVFIIAAGAVCTPQILVNSGLANYGKDQRNSLIPYFGQRIGEQPLAFCQTVMYKEYTGDVQPNDPEPQVWGPFSENAQWHIQIHRDAFSYGKIPANVQKSHIVDFRWFGKSEPRKNNIMYFASEESLDTFGMPQPTFEYTAEVPSHESNADKMMADMCRIASKIGRFLPGAEPRFMEPGLALHLGGTHRSGMSRVDDKSVVDTYSKVWDFTNLYLGGVGNIPTAYAANPTLTAMGYAIRSAEIIAAEFSDPDVTPYARG